jgi:hypothetical protein
MKRACAAMGWLLLAGCGVGTGSHDSFPLSTDSRDLGPVDLAGFDLHVVATRTGNHRYPCQPTWGRGQACTSARITSVLTLEGGPQPYAYDPGWVHQQIVTIADNEATSEERVEQRARERLAGLRLATCSDGSQQHAAYRVEWEADPRDLPGWTLVSVVSGAIVGHVEALPEGTDCAGALRAAAAFGPRIASDLAAGTPGAFAFVARRETAYRHAIDLSLEHPVDIDRARVRLPAPDDDLLAGLSGAFARGPALREHLVARLLSTTTFPPGTRGGRALPVWVQRLVRAMPTSPEKLALFEGLALRCGSDDLAAACPEERWAALFEASFALDDGERCARALPIARGLLAADPSEVEVRGLSAFHALTGCDGAADLAFDVLAARGHFATRDETFVYPLCLSALELGTGLERCLSLPAYALLVSPPRCDAAMLESAHAASEDPTRPWHLAALAALHRCGRDDDARALVERLRTLPTWQEALLPDYLPRTLRVTPE